MLSSQSHHAVRIMLLFKNSDRTENAYRVPHNHSSVKWNQKRESLWNFKCLLFLEVSWKLAAAVLMRRSIYTPQCYLYSAICKNRIRGCWYMRRNRNVIISTKYPGDLVRRIPGVYNFGWTCMTNVLQRPVLMPLMQYVSCNWFMKQNLPILCYFIALIRSFTI